LQQSANACRDTAQALSGQLDAMRIAHEAAPNGRAEVITSVERLQLFLDFSLRRFPWRHHAIDDAAPSERYDCAGSATARANSSPASTRQHIAASHVVPAHEVGLDGVLPEQHRHRIMNVNGRDVAVCVHALQSLNQSRFEWVSHHRFSRYRWSAVQGFMNARRLRTAFG
jgi:hypothetical protein